MTTSGDITRTTARQVRHALGPWCLTIMGLKPGSQSIPLTLMWLVVELCVIEGKLKFWQNFILRQSKYRPPTLGVKTFSVKR